MSVRYTFRRKECKRRERNILKNERANFSQLVKDEKYI